MHARLQPKYVVAIIYVTAIFASALDTTAVNVALPTLAKQFNATTASIDWVITGYLLSLAVWVPASGWIGDRFGTKRTFLVAIGIFTIASALCGQAQSLQQIVLFRILQGVGGGMMTPVGFAMLMRAFPPAERAAASRILLIPITIGPSSGPILGGFLVDAASWRWVFYLNLPVGVFALLLGFFFLHEHREPRAGAFDLPGFVLSGAGLALVLYSLSQGPTRGWESPVVWGTGALALATFALLAWVELRRAEPMLQLRLIGDRLFRATMATSSFTSMAWLGVLFVMPLFLQDAHGASPFQSGLTTFTEAIGVMTGSQVVGRLYPSVGPRRLMAGGLLAMCALMLSLQLVDAGTNLWVLRVLMYLLGTTMSCVIMPNQASALARIASADTGRASAILNTQQRMSQAIGVAVLATVLSFRLPHVTGAEGQLLVPAFHDAFLAAAMLALVGFFFALRIHDSDAAATMRPRRVKLTT